MKKRVKALITLGLSLCILSSFGFKAKGAGTDYTIGQGRRIVSYFPNWGFWLEGNQKIQVKDIAWDKVTHINHAFWEITPTYDIQSTDEWVDFAEKFGHEPTAAEDWEKNPILGFPKTNPAGHFAEYKYYKSQYPNVKLILSVGGWTRSEKFSDMALTDANRKTFANNLVKFLKTYKYFDGIDLDWEYPGVTRAPEDDKDRGSIGRPEDKENFTLLLKTIRETFDANNMKNKLLTVAVSAGEAKVRNTEPDKYHQYVDYIGVMTYDYAGSWDKVTGHLAPLYGNSKDPSPDRKNFNTDFSMKLFRDEFKVPANKLLAGTPLYSRGWGGVAPGPNGDGLFQAATADFKGNLGEGGQYSWYDIDALEKAGWKKFRDPVSRAPYLYNATLKQFVSYEDETSLQERCSYVNENNYGGLIVWDASGDNVKNGFTMHSIMKDFFANNKIIEQTFEAEDVDKNRVVDALDLAAVAANYNKTNAGIYDINKDGIVDIYDLVKVAIKLPSPEIVNPDDPTKPDTSKDTYDPTKAYSGGQTCIYKGITYKAKWWTQGEEPGVAAVWEKVS